MLIRELLREEQIKIQAYHGGTVKSASDFSDQLVGSNTDPGFLGKGFYFTDSLELAD